MYQHLGGIRMNEYWTRQELSNKIDWEGGLDSFFYHWGGALAKRIDPEDTEFYTLAQRIDEELYELLPEPGFDDED
jgi:hypothetical protein